MTSFHRPIWPGKFTSQLPKDLGAVLGVVAHAFNSRTQESALGKMSLSGVSGWSGKLLVLKWGSACRMLRTVILELLYYE